MSDSRLSSQQPPGATADFPPGLEHTALTSPPALDNDPGQPIGIDDVEAARVYGFAAHELELAGFSQRLRGYVETKTDMEALEARLGGRLTDDLAAGGAMTREQVSELLYAIEKTVPDPQL